MTDVQDLLLVISITAAVLAFGCWVTRRQIRVELLELDRKPSFVSEAHRDDYRAWYVKYCAAVEWLQHNPRAPMAYDLEVPRVIAAGSVVPVDFKHRARRAA